MMCLTEGTSTIKDAFLFLFFEKFYFTLSTEPQTAVSMFISNDQHLFSGLFGIHLDLRESLIYFYNH